MSDIVLFKLPAGFGLPSVSPYCLKVEAWMQIQGVAYTAQQGDLRKPRNKKMPYVLIDGEQVCDSHNILPRLAASTGKPMHQPQGEDKARAHAAMVIAQESVYWALVYARWTMDSGWVHLEPLVRGLLPAPLRALLIGVIRKATNKQVWQQGTGRLGPEFVWERAREDLDSLSHLLGDRAYFGGEQICDYDLGVWAPLASIHLGPPDGPLKDAVAGHANLVAWIERVDALRNPS